MTIAISCMVSVLFCIMGLIAETLVPWGYTDRDAATFGFTMNIVGVPAGFLAAGIITKTGKFK